MAEGVRALEPSSPANGSGARQSAGQGEQAPAGQMVLTNDAQGGVAGNEATADGGGGDDQQQQLQPQQQGTTIGSVLKGLLMRALIIYLVSSYFKRTPATTQNGTASGGGSVPTVAMQASSNIWSNGTPFDLYVYVSDDEHSNLHFKNPNALLWKQENLVYGDWSSGPNFDGLFYFNGSFKPTDKMINNGTIFFHVYTVLSGKSPDPSQPNFLQEQVIHRSRQLNKFKKKVYKRTHNLLTGETEQSVEDQQKAELTTFEILSMWHPNLTINIVDDHTAWVQGKVPKPLDEYVEFDPHENKYYPILYLNDYWNLNKDYYPINETTQTLPVFFTFQPMTLFKWQLYVAQSMRKSMVSWMMVGTDEATEDQDALKEALLDTNPYLLGMTVVVSLVHSVFEFLAFKNDIQFWKERKSLEGLSVRSVFFNVFQSLIVLLYILDNDTNPVVKFSVFAGMCIECWKVKKVVNIRIDRETRSVFGLLPLKIHFEDKGTYVESSTKEYDEMAFKYLGVALFPLIVGYCGYSLMYHEHKGWYSFIVSMVYGFLLTFGFIMMTPQLFINYKLKSVAHLPWRMLSYKFLNTFIDDIFAFVIKMPMMYRIGCFRDDIVFLIYLYQRWIYRVDPRRINEFGTSAEDEQKRQKGAIIQQDTTESAQTVSGEANSSKAAVPTSTSSSASKSRPKQD
ncbi:cleft lip and palate transmembrane protein 1 homolog [Varroa jacobsoni]|uniref:Cleft lip and palate associated transmembrane protein n=1 Tax=Varroa destructor TaxID=109461 RepID=A0A7M7M9H8_VARDE|nr:cleft lip and palate transmembrane protein 1 homolog [Varroa destructor]XP_022698130.1 cleft lip and palate transmembrane protein 1 homolog [Varroa jacobsoni]